MLMIIIFTSQQMSMGPLLIAGGFAVGAIAGGANGYRLSKDKNCAYRVAGTGAGVVIGTGAVMLVVCGVRSQQYINRVRQITKVHLRAPSFIDRLWIGVSPRDHWANKLGWHEYYEYESAKLAFERSHIRTTHIGKFDEPTCIVNYYRAPIVLVNKY